jgi:hypothetical protein
LHISDALKLEARMSDKPKLTTESGAEFGRRIAEGVAARRCVAAGVGR